MKFLSSILTGILVAGLCFTGALRLTVHPFHSDSRSVEIVEARPGGEAQEAFQWWYEQRAMPGDLIPSRAYAKAFHQFTLQSRKQNYRSVQSISGWHSLGPNNVGGRVLSLAIDPDNPNIIWAGAASGGLWKSTTGGAGAAAWSMVSTGFPTLSVSAIAIDTMTPAVMYIGTGEISLYQRPLIGVRGARASYGMGILKSTDSGVTWDTTSLTWSFSAITAVEKIAINPLNHFTLYAATSEGTYKSINAGGTWTQIFSEPMAMDIAINPADTTILYVACGNYNSTPNPGLYKSMNAGQTWSQLTSGLPVSNFGRTALAISPSNPSIVYAGIADAASQGMQGLFRTSNGGSSWTLVNSINYVRDQGWYNNVVAVHPTNPNLVYCAGIDVYRSTNGGANLSQVSNWMAGYDYVTPGGPEGASNYSHADHHALAFDPVDPQTIYFGNDGGVFRTTDGGSTFAGRNGGFVTTQFYPGLACSASDSTVALGGLQDNGVLLYEGTAAWYKAMGGDGGWCVIDQTNDNIMYGEYINLALSKSTDRGYSFIPSDAGLPGVANFIAPFVIAPSNHNILYAGANTVYKSTNQAGSWFKTNGGVSLNGTNISAIAVSFSSADTVLAATGSGGLGDNPLFQIFASTNGGASWSNVTDALPNRYPTCLAFDPQSAKTAYVTFSGYGTPHVYKTTNIGASWTNASGNLPDIPTQCIKVNPDRPMILYAGTDLGVFQSIDGGTSWQDYNEGMPLAMIHDLSFSPANNSLRTATHGLGVYERPLPRYASIALLNPIGGDTINEGDVDTIRWTQHKISFLRIEASLDSGTSWLEIADSVPASSGCYVWVVPRWETTRGLLRLTDCSDDTVSSTNSGSIIINRAPDIVQGWNLLSLDAIVNDPHVPLLFPEAISSAFIFDRAYASRDTISPGSGFWMKFPAKQNYDFLGTQFLQDTIALKKGWSLIGALSVPIAVSDIGQDSAGLIISQIYGYSTGYYSTDSLRPKHGYWIKTSRAGTITLTNGAAQKIVAANLTGELKNASTITFSSIDGPSRTLCLSASPFTASRYELPPLPPEGGFDVRFASGYSAEQYTGHRQILPIVIHSSESGITITWNINGAMDNLRLLSNGKKLHELVGVGSLTLSGAITNLAIEHQGGEPVPPQFALMQNYPNPFNPSTAISYDLPSPSNVRLVVYDISGKIVAALVDGVQDGGRKTVSWNAANIASGIYFCRLEASAIDAPARTFTEVRKLLLVK